MTRTEALMTTPLITGQKCRTCRGGGFAYIGPLRWWWWITCPDCHGTGLAIESDRKEEGIEI